jgi:hypothetical protein
MAGGHLATPRMDVLRAVLAALDEAGVVAALGGSGLLAALGLVDRVRDWDVTTDADPDAVRSALDAYRLAYRAEPAGDGVFATTAHLCVNGDDHDVDLIVGFAVRVGDAVITLPTRVTGHWDGIPLGDPGIWATAYRHLGRHDRADVLEEWLST